MNEKRRLILRILKLLDILNHSQNQSVIGEIRGLLYELLNSN